MQRYHYYYEFVSLLIYHHLYELNHLLVPCCVDATCNLSETNNSPVTFTSSVAAVKIKSPAVVVIVLEVKSICISPMLADSVTSNTPVILTPVETVLNLTSPLVA